MSQELRAKSHEHGGNARRWLAVMLLAFVVSGVIQRRVEERRIAANLTWSDPQKRALEVGFLALGGFRGILADVLWVRAIRHQESARYYELKLLCDMILQLQPTFTQVIAFQSYNMSYNLAYRSESGEDRWYWIRAGLTTLEKGLERNYRNYGLWFELGYQYFDRLGDVKMGGFRAIRQRELPRIDELTADERKAVFLKEEERRARWAREGVTPLPARPDEHVRFAAYYFWQAMATGTDPTPLRTERVYGDCIEKLGHFHSKKSISPERRNWDDWGAEDWWVELRKRNAARGMPYEDTVPVNLKFCLYQQMDYYVRQAAAQQEQGDTAAAAKVFAEAGAAHSRYLQYFPDDQKSLRDLLERYRGYRAKQAAANINVATPVPLER